MGTGYGSGEERAENAANQAIASPLLEEISISGARGVLINVTGGEDMTLFDVNTATSIVYQAAGSDANIIFGAVIDPTLNEQMRVTVIATGFGAPAQVQPVEQKEEDFIPATPGKVMSLFPDQKEYPLRAAVSGGNGRGRVPAFEDENRKIPAYIRRMED